MLCCCAKRWPKHFPTAELRFAVHPPATRCDGEVTRRSSTSCPALTARPQRSRPAGKPALHGASCRSGTQRSQRQLLAATGAGGAVLLPQPGSARARRGERGQPQGNLRGTSPRAGPGERKIPARDSGRCQPAGAGWVRAGGGRSRAGNRESLFPRRLPERERFRVSSCSPRSFFLKVLLHPPLPPRSPPKVWFSERPPRRSRSRVCVAAAAPRARCGSSRGMPGLGGEAAPRAAERGRLPRPSPSR